MKRIMIMTLLLSAMGVCGATAQEKGLYVLGDLKGVLDDYNSDVRFRPMELTVSTCYAPNRTLWFGLDFTGTTGLFETDDTRYYQQAASLGLGLGVNMFHIDETYVALAGSAGSTILGRDDWKFTYLDGGVRWFGETNAFLGLGVRYYKSRTSRFRDYTTLYGTLGLKLWGRSR